MSLWEQKHFAHLACFPPHSKAGSPTRLLTVTPAEAFNLSPSPQLTTSFLPPLHHPLTLPRLHFLSLVNLPHMLCWHVACCVCQLVNARCTAADKDQKDITNNRLLTGERDTQVPPRKSPLQLTRSTHPQYHPLLTLCPHLLPNPTTFTSAEPLHSKTTTLLCARLLFLIGSCLNRELTESLDCQSAGGQHTISPCVCYL